MPFRPLKFQLINFRQQVIKKYSLEHIKMHVSNIELEDFIQKQILKVQNDSLFSGSQLTVVSTISSFFKNNIINTIISIISIIVAIFILIFLLKILVQCIIRIKTSRNRYANISNPVNLEMRNLSR